MSPADEVAMWAEVAELLGVLFVDVAIPKPEQCELFPHTL